jgi:hypothetical protein
MIPPRTFRSTPTDKSALGLSFQALFPNVLAIVILVSQLLFLVLLEYLHYVNPLPSHNSNLFSRDRQPFESTQMHMKFIHCMTYIRQAKYSRCCLYSEPQVNVYRFYLQNHSNSRCRTRSPSDTKSNASKYTVGEEIKVKNPPRPGLDPQLYSIQYSSSSSSSS